CTPAIAAVRLRDGQVVDRGQPPAHEPRSVELPVLVAVGAEPVARIIVPLVRDPHRDAILAEGPDFLDQPIVELAVPLATQELLDCGASLQELRAVTPLRVLSVGECDTLRIARVPAVLRHPDLGDRALQGEGWPDRRG